MRLDRAAQAPIAPVDRAEALPPQGAPQWLEQHRMRSVPMDQDDGFGCHGKEANPRLKFRQLRRREGQWALSNLRYRYWIAYEGTSKIIPRAPQAVRETDVPLRPTSIRPTISRAMTAARSIPASRRAFASAAPRTARWCRSFRRSRLAQRPR